MKKLDFDYSQIVDDDDENGTENDAAEGNGAIYIVAENLGPQASDEDAQRAAAWLCKNGYNAIWGYGLSSGNVPDDVWQDCLDELF